MKKYAKIKGVNFIKLSPTISLELIQGLIYQAEISSYGKISDHIAVKCEGIIQKKSPNELSGDFHSIIT